MLQAMPAAVAVELHTLDVLTAQWCAQCALPSGMKITAAIVDRQTLRIVGRVARWVCHDCGTALAVPV